MLNSLQLLQEMYITDTINESDDEYIKLLEEMEDIPIMEESIDYSPECVPIFESSDGYFIEYSLIETFFGSDIDILECVNILEEVNNINNLTVVIESENSLKMNILRLKKMLKNEKDPKNKSVIQKRIDDCTKSIEKLKSKGKVVKKKK